MAYQTPNHTAPQQNQGLIALSIAFVVLNALDAQLTLLAVGDGHTELNPIMRVLLAQPDWVFWSSKISWAMVFTLALVIASRTWPSQVRRIFIILVTVMSCVCILNLAGVVL